MATVNLGRIKPVFKGTWSNSTAYTVDDFVVHANECYIAIQAGTNQNPASASSYWTKIAAKGSDGTDVGAALSNNQIAYKNNSGTVTGLSIGSAGQFLKVNSSANGYEYGAVSSDYVKLASGTIGQVSTISIDGYFTSDYDYYKLIIMNLRNDTANRQLFWRFNQGGSALTGNNYRHASKGNYRGTSGGNNDTATSSWGSDYFNFGWDNSTGSDRGSQYEINIYDPLSTTNNKFCTYFMSMDVTDANYISSMFGGGYYNDGGGTALSGITIFPQANNFNTGGKWKLYGLKA